MNRPLPLIAGLKLAAAETELACLTLALAQVKEDRDELRQERDDWRREAEMLCAEKLREADEQRFAADISRPSPWPNAPGKNRWQCRRVEARDLLTRVPWRVHRSVAHCRSEEATVRSAHGGAAGPLSKAPLRCASREHGRSAPIHARCSHP